MLIAVIAVILLVLYLIRRKQNYERFWKHLEKIPGPKANPLIGNFVALDSEQAWERDRRLAREYNPIYKIYSWGIANVYITSPEDIEQVLNNIKHNEKSKLYEFLEDWLGTGLLTSGGVKWHKRRKTLTPAFHLNILQEFTDMLNRETKNLVNNLKEMTDKPYVNILKPLLEFTLYSVGETSLGIKLSEDPKCEEYKQAVLDYGENFAQRAQRPWLFLDPIYKMSELYRKNQKIINVLHEFSSSAIKKRRNGKGIVVKEGKKMPLLELMLNAQENGADLDDEGIREELDTFIFGGHDTTAMALSHMLFLLANHKNIQEEIYQEIISVLGDNETPSYNDLNELKYMDMCIKETLRLYPSAALIARVAGEDIHTKSGYVIPKGCDIMISIYDLHRNPNVWENPDKFDPDRFLPDNIARRHRFAFLPFSAGSRNCIGQKFALMEMKIALCGILKNFKIEPYDRLEHLRYKNDISLRPVTGIKVQLVSRD